MGNAIARRSNVKRNDNIVTLMEWNGAPSNLKELSLEVFSMDAAARSELPRATARATVHPVSAMPSPQLEENCAKTIKLVMMKQQLAEMIAAGSVRTSGRMVSEIQTGPRPARVGDNGWTSCAKRSWCPDLDSIVEVPEQ